MHNNGYLHNTRQNSRHTDRQLPMRGWSCKQIVAGAFLMTDPMQSTENVANSNAFKWTIHSGCSLHPRCRVASLDMPCRCGPMTTTQSTTKSQMLPHLRFNVHLCFYSLSRIVNQHFVMYMGWTWNPMSVCLCVVIVSHSVKYTVHSICRGMTVKVPYAPQKRRRQR